MSNPVAFITGASRGIGRGIALSLAEKGYDIVGAATKADPENLESGLYEVKSRVEGLGQEFLPVTGDVSNQDDHETMVAAALEKFGKIDVLVNNAGIAPEQRLDILDTTAEIFQRVLDVNLQGPFFLSQRIAHEMIHGVGERLLTRPCIIFITSISATAASPSRSEYCISKSGLSMAAQTFSVRLAEFGINVYEIQPGFIKTDMTEAVTDKYDRFIEEGMLLQKRWGTPQDIGKAVASLTSGDFEYATGAVIEVGGGFGVRRL